MSKRGLHDFKIIINPLKYGTPASSHHKMLIEIEHDDKAGTDWHLYIHS